MIEKSGGLRINDDESNPQMKPQKTKRGKRETHKEKPQGGNNTNKTKISASKWRRGSREAPAIDVVLLPETLRKLDGTSSSAEETGRWWWRRR